MSKDDFPYKSKVNIFELATMSASKPKILLWCDPDETGPDARAISALAAANGVTLYQVTSTAAALKKFTELGPAGHLYERFFRVLTNNSRWEDDNGNPIPPDPNTRRPPRGVLLCKKLREANYSGPIMVYCANKALALDALAKEMHAMVTVSRDTAHAFASFKSMCRDMSDDMYPNYAMLQTEAVESRDVTAEEVHASLQHLCVSKGKSPPPPLSLGPGPTETKFKKWYIPRSSVSLENADHKSQLFHMVEDLVYRQCFVGGKHPEITRVIVIENERLRAKFDAALQAVEYGTMDVGWGPSNENYLDVLRMMMPDLPKYRRAKPTLLFHATNDVAEKVICSSGFSMDFLGATTGNEGWYGKGFYMTSFPTYARWYQGKRSAPTMEGKICFVVSWAILGKTHVQTVKDTGCPAVAGHHTHYAITKTTRPIEEGQIPDGDEIVNFDPDFALPLFIVEMDKPKS